MLISGSGPDVPEFVAHPAAISNAVSVKAVRMMIFSKRQRGAFPPPVRLPHRIGEVVSLHVIQHLFGRGGILAGWFELQVLLKVSLGVGVLLNPYIEHAELVVGRRELVVRGDGALQQRLRFTVLA